MLKCLCKAEIGKAESTNGTTRQRDHETMALPAIQHNPCSSVSSVVKLLLRVLSPPSSLPFRFESQQFQSFKPGERMVKGDQPQPCTLGKRSQIRVRPEVW